MTTVEREPVCFFFDANPLSHLINKHMFRGNTPMTKKGAFVPVGFSIPDLTQSHPPLQSSIRDTPLWNPFSSRLQCMTCQIPLLVTQIPRNTYVSPLSSVFPTEVYNNQYTSFPP